MPHSPRTTSIALAAAAAALAALAACASSKAGPPPDQITLTPQTSRVETPSESFEMHTVSEDRAEASTIKVSFTQAWTKIAAVYGDLSLPVNTFVDQTHQIGAKGARARGHLGKLRMSQILTCGRDVTGDDKANSYEVSLDVTSALSPAADDQTTIMTLVQGNARPMSTSGDPVRCASTGLLEKRIALALTLRAAGK